MGDFITVSRGMPPWQPTDDSELMVQYAYYDFPTIGVVHQCGADYLFRCILDADEGVSFWTFFLVQAAERKLIESAPTPGDFHRILDEVQAYKAVTVAMVSDELGIIEHAVVSYWDGDRSLKDAIDRLLKELRNFALHAGDVARELK